MDYRSVAEARDLPGLRLALTAHVPGPWSESAKALLKLRGVSYVAVEQSAMQPNDELREWTGHRNAPTACLDDEPPLTGWLDILMLAERLGTGPSLIPADERDRALCLGYSAEICGVDGLGWNRRLMMLEGAAAGMPPAIAQTYGMRDDAMARATERVIAVVRGLADQLRAQEAVGSTYLVGATLSAADVYWACFSNMVRPMPRDVNPMPDWLWPLYENSGEAISEAIDPLLMEHRDRIFRDHIGLPLDF